MASIEKSCENGDGSVLVTSAYVDYEVGENSPVSTTEFKSHIRVLLTRELNRL